MRMIANRVMIWKVLKVMMMKMVLSDGNDDANDSLTHPPIPTIWQCSRQGRRKHHYHYYYHPCRPTHAHKAPSDEGMVKMIMMTD